MVADLSSSVWTTSPDDHKAPRQISIAVYSVKMRFHQLTSVIWDPPFQCQVAWASHEGVEYPVVIVPSHGGWPVIAKADGPQDNNGRPVGIRQGEIYVRATGPESVAIKTPEDWTALLERCVSHRADLLANIMQRAINRPAKPVLHVLDILAAALRCDGG